MLKVTSPLISACFYSSHEIQSPLITGIELFYINPIDFWPFMFDKGIDVFFK